MVPVSDCSDCVSQTCVWIGITPQSWPDRITLFFHHFRRRHLPLWRCLPSATRAICGGGSRRYVSNIGSTFPTGRTYCCRGEFSIMSQVIRQFRPSPEGPRPENNRVSRLRRFVWRGREISSVSSCGLVQEPTTVARSGCYTAT